MPPASIIAGEDYLMMAVDHDEDMRAVDWKQDRLSKLYIEEGMSKHSDSGSNSQIGRVTVVEQQLLQDKEKVKPTFSFLLYCSPHSGRKLAAISFEGLNRSGISTRNSSKTSDANSAT